LPGYKTLQFIQIYLYFKEVTYVNRDMRDYFKIKVDQLLDAINNPKQIKKTDLTLQIPNFILHQTRYSVIFLRSPDISNLRKETL